MEKDKEANKISQDINKDQSLQVKMTNNNNNK